MDTKMHICIVCRMWLKLMDSAVQLVNFCQLLPLFFFFLQRQCDSYRAILCKGHIAPGLEGKAPINPTSLPSDSPIPPSLPSNLPSLPPLPPSPSQLPPSLPPAEALPKSRKKRKEFETVNNVVKE